uniref:Uroporphyrinogen-III synthase n=1 Tax=Anthurium amnicola TaxID=1678845 RepID=A0A1D1XZ74_9ARAE
MMAPPRPRPRPPLATAAARAPLPLLGRRIAFTTPPAYAGRLAHLLELRGATPLPVPAVIVEPTPCTLAALARYASRGALDPFSALAFTSRTGISALALALALSDAGGRPPLADSGELFTVCALGKDAELLDEGGFLPKLCRNPRRVRVLVPEVASPAGMVDSLGEGAGRRVLCPVPAVVGLAEPPVIPELLRSLEARGWVALGVPAYETRWAGPRCAEALVGWDGVAIDAVVFTSSAEVEGLLKGLECAGWAWGSVRERWPGMLVAAHGPVTADGAERLGVTVDVVGSKFSSFDGVLEALASKWAPPLNLVIG